jgi:hypothetical protein
LNGGEQMGFEEVLHTRRLSIEDAWGTEAQLRQIKDLQIVTTSLRKKSWTIYCETVNWSTLASVLRLVKPRNISEKKHIDDIIYDVQKTRGNRRVKVFELTGGGRIRVIAKNACFDRKEPIDKSVEWTQKGNGKYIGDCVNPKP